MTDIFQQIKDTASELTENDLSWIVPELLNIYNTKLYDLARKIYLIDGEIPSVAIQAFKSVVEVELSKAVHTFLFKSQHWKTGRDLNPYLITCLNRTADKVKSEGNTGVKINVLACPVCKLEGRKEILQSEGQLWRCSYCSEYLEIFSDQLKKETNPQAKASLETKMRVYRAFSLHSRKGYRCMDCRRFIPDSANTEYGLACSYSDCSFMGRVEQLELMGHPTTQTYRTFYSLNAPVAEDTHSFQDLMADQSVSADVQINFTEQHEMELQILQEVIEDQLASIKRNNASGTMIQKILMYEAYKKMLQQYPHEMVAYLVHRKQNHDFGVQIKIFQIYAEFIENYLPFSIECNNRTIDIFDLTDPALNLFTGISEFEAEVQEERIVPNLTKETYIGGRKYRNYGRYFIGRVIDIKNSDGQSLKNEIKEYNFVQIQMTDKVLPGTRVSVKHYNLKPHYQLDGMVFLQDVRRKIVDKVYYRLNKNKRQAGT